MTRFKLLVEYDGRPYQGWQIQPHGPSVQQAIQEALLSITQSHSTLVAAGRTDQGVHAKGQVVHVDIEKPITAERLQAGLNARLKPHPIAIVTASAVSREFHARFSATKRHYCYWICNRRAPLTFEKGLVWHHPIKLDCEAMAKAAQHLIGKHDFTTFRSIHCQAKSATKTLDCLEVTRIGDRIQIWASAPSFLHHQVRSMVGCLSLVGRGYWSSDDLQTALEKKDRCALGFNAPPDGLYFMAVEYPQDE